MLKRTVALACIAAAAAFAGCGGDDEDGAPATVDTTTVETAPADTTAVETTPEESADPDDTGLEPVEAADVTLTEFDVELTPRRLAQEGVYTFVVANDGEIAHALAVEGPNGTSETDEIAPGESAELDAYLVTGAYRVYCPLGNHEQRGMRTRLRVRG